MAKEIEDSAILQVRDLWVYYGSIKALSGLDLDVRRETVTIIGPNGAGKTTLLLTISGLLRPRGGTISFQGRAIHRIEPHKIVQMGLVHIPERGKIFGRMTVCENVLMGALGRIRNKDFSTDLDRVFELFPILRSRQLQLAGTLSGGEQQMLALGRAIISHPRLLMLDEPSLGLAPLLVRNIFMHINHMTEEGVPILLVEQNARQALKVAHRGYVVKGGSVVLSGTVAELAANSEVIEAYLGQ